MGTLTGNIKKCEEHPNELCWLWEWEPGTVCPACGATQSYLHQPAGGGPTPRALVKSVNHVIARGSVKLGMSLPRAAEQRDEAEQAGAQEETDTMHLCGNCGVPRFIHHGIVETCPNCGDDEYDAVRTENAP